jgi:hypothetical protein
LVHRRAAMAPRVHNLINVVGDQRAQLTGEKMALE